MPIEKGIVKKSQWATKYTNGCKTQEKYNENFINKRKQAETYGNTTHLFRLALFSLIVKKIVYKNNLIWTTVMLLYILQRITELM